MLRRSITLIMLALALCTYGVGLYGAQDTMSQEAALLAKALKWRHGGVLAEIGAGDGRLTLEAEKRVSPSGKVYSTELDPKKLAHLQELAGKESNVTALKSSAEDTDLPSGACDSIWMRLVYHHLTQPEKFDASIFQSLKPGGRLAVIDEEPNPGSKMPEGVPANRVGHGVPQKILIEELTAAGFKVESIHNDWPSRDATHQMYCVVFRKVSSK
jgi:SAM-dependent methyltransferase